MELIKFCLEMHVNNPKFREGEIDPTVIGNIREQIFRIDGDGRGKWGFFQKQDSDGKSASWSLHLYLDKNSIEDFIQTDVSNWTRDARIMHQEVKSRYLRHLNLDKILGEDS